MFVVIIVDVGITGAIDGVDFVNEDDVRGVFFCFFEEIVDVGCIDIDEYFNEFRIRDGEEWDISFIGDCFGE